MEKKLVLRTCVVSKEVCEKMSLLECTEVGVYIIKK